MGSRTLFDVSGSCVNAELAGFFSAAVNLKMEVETFYCLTFMAATTQSYCVRSCADIIRWPIHKDLAVQEARIN